MPVTAFDPNSTSKKMIWDKGDDTHYNMEKNAPNLDDYRCGFEASIANGVNTQFAKLLKTGGGMTVNQSNGKLVIASGTNAKSETIIRMQENSVDRVFNVPFNYRTAMMLSARNANQSFIFEMVDIVGDGLGYSATSATSITVTKPNHGFDAIKDIGKKMNIGNFDNDIQPSQEIVIASIAGDAITYTGAGFTIGNGTCSLFGLNSIYMIYDGTTATSYKVGSRRKGRDFVAGGSPVTGTSTAAMLADYIFCSRNSISWADKVAALVTNNGKSTRACIESAIPDPDVNLVAQIRVVNGTTAPAAASLTVDFVSVLCALDPVGVNIFASENGGASPLEVKLAQSNESIGGIAALPALAAGTNVVGGFFDAAVANTGGYGAPTKLPSSAASTNATLVKSSAGRAYRFKGKNNVASVRYLKLFNKATAPVTGTDTPTETFILEPNAPFDIIFEKGRYFALGVGFAITGAIADNDNTAIAAGDITGLMVYYA